MERLTPYDWEPIETRALLAAKFLYGRQAVQWKKELLQTKSLKSFVNLSPLDKRIGKLFEKAITVMYLRGRESVKDEINRQLTMNFDDPSKKLILGYDDIIRMLLKKKIISPQAFKDASAEIKSITFSVQKIERITVLKKIRASIEKAIADGQLLSDWRGDLNDIFKATGITPLDPWHVETVFRTNMASVFNISRLEAGFDDDNTVAFQYFGIADSRQSEICQELDGLIYAKDDPIWFQITPPNHYNCRSTLIPLSDFYMEAKGLEYANRLKPGILEKIDEDFASSPVSLTEYSSMVGDKLAEDQAEI
jgi:SPP1 gp7 family putative phage head morphogenesis protein